MKRYIWDLLILIDCVVDSALFGSSPFETISSRCWRHRITSPTAALAVNVIDWLAYHLFGQAHHCESSVQSAEFWKGREIIK